MNSLKKHVLRSQCRSSEKYSMLIFLRDKLLFESRGGTNALLGFSSIQTKYQKGHKCSVYCGAVALDCTSCSYRCGMNQQCIVKRRSLRGWITLNLFNLGFVKPIPSPFTNHNIFQLKQGKKVCM